MTASDLFKNIFGINTDIKFPKNVKWTDIDSFEFIVQYLYIIIRICLDLAIIIGVFMIFYSSFLYITSFGDDSKAETAKKTLMWAAIGTLVVLAAQIIVNIFTSGLAAS